ncbi:hypothetical protein, partial [uncultured Tenacibaculum sp.]|uniref:hypothetical protein n=1 Tax=uncultured Tenacibaculum sp. TaxID=174713 RepID=UPI002638D2D0
RINWSSSFDTAVYNESLIRLAAKREANVWYNKQTGIIKKFLENKYRKQFSSYNEAKDHAFLEHERKNRSNYVTPVINSKRSDRNIRSFKTKTNLKGLKALKIREAEIRNGIINYPIYPNYEVNGVPLKDIKDINTLNNAYSNLLGQFIDNKWREFESDYITKIFGASFDNSVLKTKNSIYHSLNKWDRLDFMQFYIYYDQLVNRPTPILMNPQEAKLFEKYLNKINSITSVYVTNYVNANKNNDVSLFHVDHWKIIWKRDYGNSLFHINTAKNKHKELKEKELNRLINTTSIHATTTIDKLVSLLRITNLDELQWLNDHPHKGDEFDKRYSNAKLRDVNNPQDPSGGKILPPDYYEQLAISSIRIELANGAVIGGLIRGLGLENITQKNWLYKNNDKAEVKELIKYVNQNKVNGIINEEAKTIAHEAIDISLKLDNFDVKINKEDFNPLDDSWITTLRDLARKIESIRTRIPSVLWGIINVDLDLKLKNALTLTANSLTPGVASFTESQKQSTFDIDGKKGVGILLYEFANGEGPAKREFSNGMFWSDFFAGDRINQIKQDFEDKLGKRGLTFNQFVLNNTMIRGGNAFSPDHAGVINSISQHINANLVQFFVGGTRIEYRPSSLTGYIDVIIINPTSRYSLLLHSNLVHNYDRTIHGSIPLSTIEQYFYIRIKVR